MPDIETNSSKHCTFDEGEIKNRLERLRLTEFPFAVINTSDSGFRGRLRWEGS